MQKESQNAVKPIVGVRQVMRALTRGQVDSVFVAGNAPENLTHPIMELCSNCNVPVHTVDTMEHLGEYAGIQVSAVACAFLR